MNLRTKLYPQRHPCADPEAGRPSEASGGGSEVRGSSTRKEGRIKKRTKQVLEMWPPGPKEGRGVSEGKKISPWKKRPSKQQGRFQEKRNWFDQGGKTSKEALDIREECGSKEPQQKKKPG